MRRIVACLFACCAPLWAQFGSLSTVHDGSVLYFTTRLVQAGTVQPNHGKLFTLDGAGVRLLLAREREVYRSTGGWINPNAYTTNRYDLVGVHIAANGSKIAVAGRWECAGFTSGLCGSSQSSTVYDDAGDTVDTYPGNVRLSPNGKWGLQVRTYLSSGAAATSYQLLDFERKREFDGGALLRWRNWQFAGIAGNGTALVTDMNGLVAVRGEFAPVRLIPDETASGTIDATGTMVVASARGKLTMLRLAAAGVPAVVSKEELGEGSMPQLSADGSRLVFEFWATRM